MIRAWALKPQQQNYHNYIMIIGCVQPTQLLCFSLLKKRQNIN